MTRERMFGSDVAFCAWMRGCKELPSYGPDFGFVATDTDVIVHRYMTSVDGIGTREVQGLMHIEVKTRKGWPNASQIDTLSKLNLFNGSRERDGYHIRYFGVFLLRMSDETPDDSRMRWGVMPPDKLITTANQFTETPIDRATLIKLLRFEIHPRNFEPNAFRRHHKTRDVVSVERSPLGYEYEKHITRRS